MDMSNPYTASPEGVTLVNRRKNAPVITVIDDAGRELVRLKVVDGRLTAEYDPADLDEAAHRFFDGVMQAALGASLWT